MQAIVAFTSLLLLSGYVSGQNYRAGYFAGAPGDDPSTNGELLLYISEDNLGYRAALNNAIDVTGVHLHLQGNSSNGLFGGPLLLALTNTTVANGQAPVSSGPNTELIQQGSKTGADLQANPMRPMVAARLQALGKAGSPPNSMSELRALIDQGLVYTDVHTLKRVSPQGLTRGRVAAAPAAEHPATPAVHPATPAVHPATPAVHPATPAVHPVTPAVHPAPPAYHPATPAVHPATPAVHPVTPAVHPAPPAYHPATPAVHPTTPAVHPSPPAYHPATPAVHPSPPAYHPAPPAYHPAEGGDATANADAKAQSNGGNASANAAANAQSMGGDATANSQATAVAGRRLRMLM